MSNNPLRKDYAGDDAETSSRGWMVGAAFVLGLVGIGSISAGAPVFGWLLIVVAGALAGAGLIGIAVRD